MKKFTVLDLVDLDLKEHNALNLVCLGGRPGLTREITMPDLNRPGLALSGFFDNFGFNRIQVFGRGEHAYLQMLEREGRDDTLKELFSRTFPCAIFTHSLQPTDVFLRLAEESETPVLQSDLTTSTFVARIIRALSSVFAPRQTMHGVLVEVFGIGVLLLGDSGVGKSEAALELVERKHRLVADDAVEVRNVSGNVLLGSGANKALGHHMEIRGLGIINITHLFGVGAIRDSKQIQLLVRLEAWDNTKEYDRIGAEEQYEDILGVKVPSLQVPVKPGRNIPIIIETAAMNERLKKMGYFSAKEFNQSVLKWLETENARRLYFQKNNL
ncbi:HPr(Ser) kinase/phosphatase [Spirochaeta africana]|uniref:HPr kinase/phosphorylase n=1 Tax=Spirochaeta africana (strain ATCC 700263 / DSM 8902 / Z-7692) TaxID=889378 RepID=H9UMF2_SPIAZ|nr:HPr(Ser) kinase/phosphatase [Spirochaeta africana]AFG38695.1 Hpr(Ser) kinase/phosphatase [Spirochaeta africana DSM 8902]